MKEPENLDPRTRKHHRIVTTVFGTEAEADDLDLHHHGTTIAHGMEEAKGPSLQDICMTTKTMKSRWGRHALLAEFAGGQCPKDSSYPMISRNTMGHKNHCPGCRLSASSEDTRELEGNNNAKPTTTTHRSSTVMIK
jgi:hypothetical protein